MVAQRACKRCRHPMSRVAEIAPFGGGPGLVAFMCTDCGTTDSEPQRKPLRWSVDDPRRSATQGSRVVFQRPAGAALRQLIGTHVLSSLWNFELHPEKKVYGDWLPKGHQLNYRSTTKLHNVLDGLAMNLEKGYRPAGDFIIEDADYQPAGIPSLCIEVCPTFYRDWTIPELVMPVHDMSRSVTALIGTLVDLPQQLVRILRGERQIRIDAGVHVDPMPVNVHQRERLDPAKLLLRHDLHVDDVTIILSVGDQGGPATIIHPPSSLDWLTAALPHDVFVIALEADQFQVGRSPVHQPLDDLATLRPTIDIVAEGNDCRRSIRLRVLNDLRYRLRKEGSWRPTTSIRKPGLRRRPRALCPIIPTKAQSNDLPFAPGIGAPTKSSPPVDCRSAIALGKRHQTGQNTGENRKIGAKKPRNHQQTPIP